MILPNANNVNWVKQQRSKVPLNAMIVMREHLAKPQVFVRNAQMGFIKTAKGEQNASNATLENRTSMSKQLAVLVTLVGLAAAKVFVRRARLDSIKIPKVKTNAVIFVPRQKKYPTKNEPGVNCHLGVLAKWANI